NLVCKFDSFGGSSRAQISSDQADLRDRGCRLDPLQVRDGFRFTLCGKQNQAKVVVGTRIGWLYAQNMAEFFFRKIEFLLGQVEISQIVPGPGGNRIEPQRVLQSFQCACKILLVGQCNAQKVVALHAVRSLSQLEPDFD